jgi:gluconolactonase
VTSFLSLALLCGAALAQIAGDAKVEKVTGEQRFTEGPVWTRDNNLVFSDTPNNRLMRWAPDQGVQVPRENLLGPAGTAVDPQGRLYVCESRARRVIRIDKRNRVEVLASQWEGKRLNAPNDIVVRKDGHVWFTDPAFGSANDRRDLDFWGIYHLSPKGVLELAAKSKGRPNGVALSADGRTLFVTDSDERCIRGWDVDRSGQASRERTVVTGVPGVPGGVRVDVDGNLFVAADGVLIYSPEGRLARRVELSERPSHLAFGDADYQTLYITAQTSVYRVRAESKGAVQH